MTSTALAGRRRPNPYALGAILVATVAAMLAASHAVVGSEAFPARPHLLGAALAVDFAIVLPVLYYIVGVRLGGLPALTTVPAFLLGAALAASALPAGHPALAVLGLAVLPAEALLIGVLVYKARIAASEYRRLGVVGGGFDETFPRAAHAALGRSRAVDALASEVVLLYFAVLSWRRAPQAPPGACPFTSHRRTGWAGIFMALVIVIAVEVLAVHLLVSIWSTTTAWVLTALALYGLLWLVADYRALVLRPTLLTDRHLRIRIGMRWAADVPLAGIRRVRRYELADADRRMPRLVVAGQPNLVLELDGAVEVRGLFGLRRTAATLAVAIDGEEFAVELERGRAAAAGTGPSDGGLDRASDAADATFGRSAAGEVRGVREAMAWLLRPALRHPRRWLVFNGAFAAVVAVTALAFRASPGFGGQAVDAMISAGTAKVVLEGMAAGIPPGVLATMVFVNNFAAVMLLVVGASLLVPYAGVIAGLLLAVPLGLGAGLALGEASFAGIAAVTPLVLLEQQAVVVGMLFAWRAGKALRRGRGRAGGRRRMRRRVARGMWRTAAAVAAILVMAALYEAALLVVAAAH